MIGFGVFRISLYGIAIKRFRVLEKLSIVKPISEVKEQARVFLIFHQARLVPGDVVVGDRQVSLFQQITRYGNEPYLGIHLSMHLKVTEKVSLYQYIL